MKRTMMLACALLTMTFAMAQTNEEKAQELGTEAVKLMDNGDTKKAIDLLKQAQKLDPGNIDYPYETAYAYYLEKEYKKAVDIMAKLVKHPDANDRTWQMYGNCLDMAGKTDDAIKAYKDGLYKFPNSGRLYLESGNMFLMQKKYEEALEYYEKGIEVDPAFPSNYYWAAKIYCSSTEEVWGMLYGELFMNLERNTRRTEEISKLLYDTYASEIVISSDTSATVSFSKTATISMDNLGKEFQLPYGIAVYEPTILMSVFPEKEINLESLCRIRSRFLDMYYQNKQDKKYPNCLFDYQKSLKEAGVLDAYHHWILLKGDEDAFGLWHKTHKKEWEAFVDWFTNHPLQLSPGYRFHRTQY